MNDLLLDVLKSYVPPKDYELHDWDTIISRCVEVEDGVFKYSLVYADLYLTDDYEFYDVEPKQPNHKIFSKVSEEYELLESVLKSYVPPKDYELHDWNKIIQRREKYSDDVYVYHLIYADLYLTDDYEFYDVEPKQPNHKIVDDNYNEYEEFVINELSKYVHYNYDLDWKVIISRREKVEDNIFKYTVNGMDLYFDDEMFIVEYGKVHIIDGEVFYDFNESSDSMISGTYTKIGEVNYA